MTELVLIACAILIAFMILVMIIDNRRFVVRKYRLRSSRIKYPVKFVFIADLHEKSYGQDNEKLVTKIKEIEPDAILTGGDLIVSGSALKYCKENGSGPIKGEKAETEWCANSLSLMKKLTQICPVWFVRGNHEGRLEAYEELESLNDYFVSEMSRAGVRMLHNSAVDPAEERHGHRKSGILLQGLELPIEYYKKFRRTKLPAEELNNLLGTPDRSEYVLLLTHSPVYFPQYAKWGSDLCLCGHVHGGLMRLPIVGGVVGTRPSLFPKYNGGQYYYRVKAGKKERLSAMIVTCGLGMHTLPIRIFNPGEVSVIELLPSEW